MKIVAYPGHRVAVRRREWLRGCQMWRARCTVAACPFVTWEREHVAALEAARQHTEQTQRHVAEYVAD